MSGDLKALLSLSTEDVSSRSPGNSHLATQHLVIITVEPPKRGHFGNGTFVLSSEVVLFSEVV